MENINEFVLVKDRNIDIKLIKWFAMDFDIYDNYWELDFQGMREYCEEYYTIEDYEYLEPIFLKIQKYLKNCNFDTDEDYFPIIENEFGISNLDKVIC